MRCRRGRLASLLFGLLRRQGARAAALDGPTLCLTFGSRTHAIAVTDIRSATVERAWFWSTLRLHGAGADAVVSGLAGNEARAFAVALEEAKDRWWRERLATEAGALTDLFRRLDALSDPPRYLTKRAFAALQRDAETLARRFPQIVPEPWSEAREGRALLSIQAFLSDPAARRRLAIQAYMARELGRSRQYLDTVEARPLTDEQRRAVIVDEHRNLIVAAAGSGKTSVIVAKAGWLLRNGRRQPAELLLLAFAKDAQLEMKARIDRRLDAQAGRQLSVRTFHGLGLGIIGAVEGRVPTLAKVAEDDKALLKLLEKIVAALLADDAISRLLLTWFRSQFAPYEDAQDFKTYSDYRAYLRRHDIRSLKGDRVKSFEECEIANFLYLHGVDYEYEAPYEHDTATAERRQYQPDFYLPGPDLYIEHFALSKSGTTPPFIDGDRYRRERAWKLGLHRQHGTTLIETFSHEHADGTLTDGLAAKLRARGVVLSPIPAEDMFRALKDQGRIDPFTKLIATFLHHFKSSRLSLPDLAQRARRAAGGARTEAFVTLFGPIFERYEAELREAGEIDFHDMINRAIDYVASRHYHSPYGYILVDEFQDISAGRAALLQALLGQSRDAQLFAVGDDWQAIFRFAGSDLGIMRGFEGRFGDSERVDLTTTFRCVDRIAATAKQFIERNPDQISKDVRTVRRADGPSVRIFLPNDADSRLETALGQAAEDAAGRPGRSSVLLLGRYRHLEPDDLPALGRRYPGLDLKYMTVHRSKGLEADYVVVLGLSAGKFGFPSSITDDPVLDLVLPAAERHPDAEERRLFYVAITRARRCVFLVADGGPASAFVEELVREGYDVDVTGELPETEVRCPSCPTGRLQRTANARDGRIDYRCMNRPYCGYRQPACTACRTGLVVREGAVARCHSCDRRFDPCPNCEGWLRRRNGGRGPFLGCSNWPRCRHTQPMPRPRRRRAAPGPGGRWPPRPRR